MRGHVEKSCLPSALRYLIAADIRKLGLDAGAAPPHSHIMIDNPLLAPWNTPFGLPPFTAIEPAHFPPAFEAAMAALRDGQCDLAMLPCENSLAGRVPDIHRMLPDSGLFVVGEHFQRVEHCLLAPKGASLATLKRAHSHPVALGQVLRLLKDMNLTPVIEGIPPAPQR